MDDGGDEKLRFVKKWMDRQVGDYLQVLNVFTVLLGIKFSFLLFCADTCKRGTWKGLSYYSFGFFLLYIVGYLLPSHFLYLFLMPHHKLIFSPLLVYAHVSFSFLLSFFIISLILPLTLPLFSPPVTHASTCK